MFSKNKVSCMDLAIKARIKLTDGKRINGCIISIKLNGISNL